MADSESDDKTEKASSQKLRKSREQGQVARSRDWAGAVGLLISARLLVWLAPGYLEDFRSLFALALVPLTGADTLENLWSTAFSTAIMLFLKMLAPLAAIPLAIIAASIIPGGWVLSFEHLKPNFSKLGPLGYFERLHKPRHLTELGITLAKATVLCVVLWHGMQTQYADFVALQAQPLPVAVAHGAGQMMDAILALCMVIFIFALCLREQRMSKRELKEEYKSSEGRPEIRQRIRQLQNQIARGSIRKSVPNANVVIVNPEHYAVALKYDEARAAAPFVIAKGIDEMAFYIRELARQHDIEVIPLPPLARAIYNTSQVNQQIPAQLYRAVAQVLSYVLQLQAFRGGRRKTQPPLPDALPVPEQFLTAPAEAD